ncbi:hypothetical protein EHP00_901 [Ecytonucleospora hepatopenaei]|uniref:Uncharacterized protein n=1 Tax=Ecytonucleospora hepatopenaei TaxID=646526 RepID=A0A1W0E4V3_9MICR|nr:hypothetical protein EHP00_901 [Ecytonucleospora hepatopenaei]
MIPSKIISIEFVIFLLFANYSVLSPFILHINSDNGIFMLLIFIFAINFIALMLTRYLKNKKQINNHINFGFFYICIANTFFLLVLLVFKHVFTYKNRLIVNSKLFIKNLNITEIYFRHLVQTISSAVFLSKTEAICLSTALVLIVAIAYLNPFEAYISAYTLYFCLSSIILLYLCTKIYRRREFLSFFTTNEPIDL